MIKIAAVRPLFFWPIGNARAQGSLEQAGSRFSMGLTDNFVNCGRGMRAWRIEASADPAYKMLVVDW